MDNLEELNKAVLELYDAPFKFMCGYIYDAKGNMVADKSGGDYLTPEQEGHAISRLRGWGRISYMPEPERLQDAVGAHIALALTEYWNKYKAKS